MDTVCKIYKSIEECDPTEARQYIQCMNHCDQSKLHDPSLSGHSEPCHLDATLKFNYYTCIDYALIFLMCKHDIQC